MWLVDFRMLMLIIIGGLDLGVLGFFGFDVATAVFGPHARVAYMAVVISAVWQLLRQRFNRTGSLRNLRAQYDLVIFRMADRLAAPWPRYSSEWVW